MDKNEKTQIVLDTYDEIKKELSSKVFVVLTVNQRAQLIQDRLPKEPIYCLVAINKIISNVSR